ncbi:hypothetical protein BBK82_13215 [Lentzea guizhouensis]|uniref:Uncharacterized protein n=1 Tax=Lentzea guizhouensis TaxID=1586287 RepID=A0A1B2HGQ1_9PSEU|nr:hypothetical protein [Lentzea guizhouensis]ANZ36891.1 hypothetical protein BBK82_13215 [Lentzea guizhouensis]
MGEIKWVQPPRLQHVVAAYQGFAHGAGVRTGLVDQLVACSADDPRAALVEWAGRPAVQPDLVSRQSARLLVEDDYRGKPNSQGPGALIWALPAAVRRLDEYRVAELVALTHGPGSPALDAVLMLAEHLFTPEHLDPPDADPFTAAGALAQAVRGEGRGVAQAIAGALRGGPEHEISSTAEELFRRSW